MYHEEKNENQQKQTQQDYIPLMRYGIGTLRDNQQTRLSLI